MSLDKECLININNLELTKQIDVNKNYYRVYIIYD